MGEGNGRTHEPSQRELTAELDGFKALMEERKGYIEQRFAGIEQRFSESRDGVSLALNAQKALTDAAFAAAKEAAKEAKGAQDQYNVSHNDLLRKMETQQHESMPRTEIESHFKALETRANEQRITLDLALQRLQGEIANLRESRSQGTGRAEQTKWIVQTALALLSAMAGVGITLAVRN